MMHRPYATGWRSLVEEEGAWSAALFMALMAALPLAPDLVPALLISFIVATVLHHRGNFRWPAAQRWDTPLPWAVLFYLLHVLGMVWSSDMAFGWFDLQIKLPLLLLPLLANVLPSLSVSSRSAVLFVHVLINAVAVMICSIAALVRIALGSELEPAQEIFSSAFSLFLHPSYFALYLSLALASWVLTPLHRWLPLWISRALLLVLCLGVVLCGSKMGWLVLVLLLPSALLVQWSDRGWRMTLLGSAGLSLVGLGVLVAASPYARERVEEALHVALHGNNDANAETSSAVRTITWSAAITLFKEAPLLGTGTGDIKNELILLYAQRGQHWAQERRLNAHGQFLQSAACLGIGGVGCLAFMVLAPFFGRFRKDALAVAFVVICALNWSVESMLEVQAGVVWTAMMVLLLFPKDHAANE